MTTVLQIIPSLGAGGAEQACVDVAIGLKTAGHNPIVVSSGGRRVAELEDHGIWHIAKPVNSKNPGVMLGNALWLTQFIREHHVDIIHARSRAPAWSALLASRHTPCAFVTTFHAAYKFSNPLKKLYNSVMARSDRIIAISEFIAETIQKNYGVPKNKIRVIPRGINLDAYAPEKITPEDRKALLEQWNTDDRQPLILMPARLSPIKGQKVLIDAMSLLTTSSHNVTAIILGDDQGRTEYRHELDSMITSRNLRDNVHIVSHCDNMPLAYSLASVVVAPSLVPEGFGRVPVEAMAMGVPVVASDLGGTSENIRSGETGWLVPPGNPQKLADAILHILNQTPDQRAVIRDAALREVHARYDKRKMVADTLAVYEEVLSNKRSKTLCGKARYKSARTSGSYTRQSRRPLPRRTHPKRHRWQAQK